MTTRMMLLVMTATAGFAPSANADALVFNVDFTKGAGGLPQASEVSGGKWQNGWLPVANGNKIVFDAGYPVKNGAFEVTFTRTLYTDDEKAYLLPPWIYQTKLFSLNEDAGLGRRGALGDAVRLVVYARDRYENKQGNLSVRSKEQGDVRSSLWGTAPGKWSDLTADGKTPMSYRVEWRNGSVSFTDVKGQTAACPSDCQKQIDALQYIAIGGDNSSRGSSLGVRFLTMRMVDFDKPGTVPAGVPPANIVPQAAVNMPKEIVPASGRKRVVFDADLTKGAGALPKSATVIGGEWQNGWRVTKNQQRILFDPGYWMKNGSVEVSFARGKEPFTGEKLDVVSIHESPVIDHTDIHGDAIVLRMGQGNENNGLAGEVKTFAKERYPNHFGESWGGRFGVADDWKNDDTTANNFKIEWKDGLVYFTTMKGQLMKCEKQCEKYLDSLRYIAIGGDRYHEAESLVGATFLRVKVLDLDAPER